MACAHFPNKQTQLSTWIVAPSERWDTQGSAGCRSCSSQGIRIWGLVEPLLRDAARHRELDAIIALELWPEHAPSLCRVPQERGGIDGRSH